MLDHKKYENFLSTDKEKEIFRQICTCLLDRQILIAKELNMKEFVRTNSYLFRLIDEDIDKIIINSEISK